MFKASIALLAGVAVAATPVLAKPGGGGPQSGPPATSQGPIHSNHPMSTTTTAPPTDPTTSNRDQGRVNSQGPDNASATGVSNSNENSVLAGGSVSADSLPGLTTGLDVQSSTGASIGTVREVVTGRDGSIRMVVVTNSSGQTIRLPANSLSISGGVVTTTNTPNP